MSDINLRGHVFILFTLSNLWDRQLRQCEPGEDNGDGVAVRHVDVRVAPGYDRGQQRRQANLKFAESYQFISEILRLGKD